MNILELLVEEIEEHLYAWDEANLYEFSGFARALGSDLSEDEVVELCRQAYDRLTNRFALHLEWRKWPSRSLGPASPDSPLLFEMDSDADIATPYLVLVPDDLGATSAELRKQFRPDGPPTKRRWWSRR